MMYIGEMCFWAVKYEDCSADTMDRKEDRLQFRDIGTQILNKYVLACEGPLQGQGWNTENAKEILSILQWAYVLKLPSGTVQRSVFKCVSSLNKMHPIMWGVMLSKDKIENGKEV